MNLLREKANSIYKTTKDIRKEISKHYREELKKAEADPNYVIVSWNQLIGCQRSSVKPLQTKACRGSRVGVGVGKGMGVGIGAGTSKDKYRSISVNDL